MTSRATLSCKDFDGEGSSFGLYLPTINAGNITAVTTAVAGIQATLDDICLGSFDGLNLSISQVPASSIPASAFAQREQKWRVNYTDNVDPLGNGSFEVAMPDLAKLAPGTGKADLTDVDIAAFVTAVEGVAVSRLGNPITITELVHVGRNL